MMPVMTIATTLNDERATVEVDGCLGIESAGELLAEVKRLLKTRPDHLRIDLSHTDSVDTFGVATLIESYRLANRQNAEIRFRGLSAEVIDFLRMIDVEQIAVGREAPPPSQDSFLELTGGRCLRTQRTVRDFVVLASNALYFSFVAPLLGRGFQFLPMVRQIVKGGVNALPVVLVLAFLIGLIMAMQSSVQLREFGAEGFVPALLAVTIVRELGPFLTGVIVAARTGSAISAELGTMTVTEEVDALKTMGLNPLAFLVAPRMIALTIIVPCLTILFDIAGLAGGYCIGGTRAAIPLGSYLQDILEALDLADVTAGLVKSVFFGIGIGLISCFMGFRVQRGAEGVGRATTGSVVASIFVLVAIDLFFTGLFFMS